MPHVKFVDETTAGERATACGLDIAGERTTPRELIGRRVRHEAGGDAEPQVERALRAFQGNGLLLLVGDRQVTELDEEIELTADTEVTFLRLIALVGG